MDVLVIRHAIAEDRNIFARTGNSDELRPLTSEGRKRMQRAAAGLKTVVPRINMVATSPLVRAAQTAEIVAAAYGSVVPIEIDELRPECDSERLARWLGNQPPDSTIALVGHEPSLSFHVSWLTARADDAFVEFKKGGACLLRFYDAVFSGGATLRWMMTPKQLRGLGG